MYDFLRHFTFRNANLSLTPMKDVPNSKTSYLSYFIVLTPYFSEFITTSPIHTPTNNLLTFYIFMDHTYYHQMLN